MDEETLADMCPDAEIQQPGGLKRRTPSETLLVTDVVMPKVNGWMLAKRWRLIRPETKVLFMTAFSSELVSDYRTSLGDPVIMKPCDLADLGHKVRELLGYSSPFARRRPAKRWP